MKEMQEFEKVERHYVKEWGHHAVFMSDYDALLAYAKELQKENIRLLNDASIWRNRAIGAEEELSGAGRLEPRKGYR